MASAAGLRRKSVDWTSARPSASNIDRNGPGEAWPISAGRRNNRTASPRPDGTASIEPTSRGDPVTAAPRGAFHGRAPIALRASRWPGH
jgi:hypothetical protein